MCLSARERRGEPPGQQERDGEAGADEREDDVQQPLVHALRQEERRQQRRQDDLRAVHLYSTLHYS